MRLWHALRYVGYLLVELVRGGLRVAREALTPGLSIAPAILELPLRCRTDLEITVLTSSITITPGTLVVAVAAAREGEPATAFVHVLHGADPVAVRAGLRRMETLLLRATRGEAVGT